MCEHCTRREFLGTATTLGGMALAASGMTMETEATAAAPQPPAKVRICAIVAGAPASQSWGAPAARIEAAKKRLAEAEKNLGNVEFVMGQATTGEQTAKLLEQAGPEAPYLLRRHAELRGGAVPEVHYRVGQPLTFTKMVHLESLLMFTGKLIEVPEVPAGTERGCRTELVAEVQDAEKLLFNWGGGALGASAKDYYASLHRVAYYGDQTRNLRHLAHLLGLKVVEEV